MLVADGREGVERRRQPGGVVELSAVGGDDVREHAPSVLVPARTAPLRPGYVPLAPNWRGRWLDGVAMSVASCSRRSSRIAW